MAEILGAVASASQLAVMTMGLLNTAKKIKGGSKTLKRYQQQLQEVQVLSETISRNPLLQTPDVDYYTRSILVNISQNNLEHRLKRGWLSRTCTLLYKDRDLVEFFIILDRQKSSLSLVIENIQSRALHQIQSDIRAMGKPCPPFENPPSPPDSDTEASSTPSPKYTEPQAMDRSSKSSADRDQTRKTTESSDHKPEVAEHDPRDTYASYKAKIMQEMDMNFEILKKMKEKGMKGGQYYENEAGDNVPMHCGLLIDSSLAQGHSKPIDFNSSSPDTFMLNKSRGRGRFTQGVRMEFSEKETINKNNPQPIVYTALYRKNYGVAINVKDPGSDAASWVAPDLCFGPSYVRKGASNAVAQPADDGPTMPLPISAGVVASLREGMLNLGVCPDKFEDQDEADEKNASS